MCEYEITKFWYKDSHFLQTLPNFVNKCENKREFFHFSLFTFHLKFVTLQGKAMR